MGDEEEEAHERIRRVENQQLASFHLDDFQSNGKL